MPFIVLRGPAFIIGPNVRGWTRKQHFSISRPYGHFPPVSTKISMAIMVNIATVSGKRHGNDRGLVKMTMGSTHVY